MSLTRLTVGFLPLLDCAPLVVAADKGFAAAEGLELALVRESSWANIRDRVVIGQFDAAHMLAPMAIAATLGIGHVKVPMAAPISLGLGGNAITVSATLWGAMLDHGAHPGAGPRIQGMALHEVIRRRARAGAAPLTLAMVYPFSAHNYELRYWLAACGIDPDEDVLLTVVPPPLMVEALRAGQIDGFCSGEPWNSLAVAEGIGRIVCSTTAIWRRSPEKVLGMRTTWADAHGAETAALVRAVYHACVWCDRPDTQAELAQLLAQPCFVGEAADIVQGGLAGRLRVAPATPALDMAEFVRFAAHHATFPWVSHALWFYTQMVRWKQIAPSAAVSVAARATYRPDLYRAALDHLGLALPSSDVKDNGAADVAAQEFFDGQVFDPNSVD